MFGDEMAAARRQALKLPAALRDKFLQTHDRPGGTVSPGPWSYLWAWWSDIRMGCGEGFSGPAPMTHQDVVAWRVNSEIQPTPDEVRLLLVTDTAWRAECHRLRDIKRPKKGT